ncbi:arsenate reductase [Sulfitobacter sp. F26204]|uniref:ArsC/Spx/MgsR family protein n=1 Tax=Sulfitobacter sp. F26204 TaxID=2996014 RepID=UPI00225E59EF|nr:ArsC/Spx/MgsR family protein [Sulfitobacter sp. F26204]MCX7559168.1 arsenate reductase [Sulfitobacter sp. F26204]
MIIYGLKNCDTCRKVMKALPGAELRDVRVDPVPEAILTAALAHFGEALVNKRSTTWRGLNESERAQQPMTLILAYPAVMKRPLIAVDKSFFLGWNSAIELEIKALL